MTSRNQNFDADEYETMKYALGLVSILLMSVYFTSQARNRYERMHTIMWSTAVVGGILAWYLATDLIVPEYMNEDTGLPNDFRVS
tara:strand:- start:2218 stop:2472 length:255 start_codon:yes stop_codon:yes gene_type:complete